MKQRHSFHRLYYHFVFTTKNRVPLITSLEDGEELFGYFRAKAAQLDGFIEENGCYRDHVHLLVRCGPTLALAELYGQLKGFASWTFNARHADRPFKWQDGVWSSTVDPDETQGLRAYIRGQWTQHESRMLIPAWEPLSDPIRE